MGALLGKLLCSLAIAGWLVFKIYTAPTPQPYELPTVEFMSQWDFKEMKYIKIREQKSKQRHENKKKIPKNR